MKNKSIFRQMLIPMITIVMLLATILVIIIAIFFTSLHEEEIQNRNRDQAELIAESIKIFVDAAYMITEELATNPSILTMQTEIQTSILKDCTERNSYLELLYIQGIDGMQTGRSSGTLADRSNRWWFIQMMEQKKAFISHSYYSVNTGMPCASIFFPMYQEDEFVGVFAADLKLDYLQSMIDRYSDAKRKVISFVIDGEGAVVAHPESIQIQEQYNYKTLTKTVSLKDNDGKTRTDINGNIVTEEQSFEISKDYQSIIKEVMTGNSGVKEITDHEKDYYISYAPITLKGESDSWSIITLQEKSTAKAVVNRMISILVFIVLVAISGAIIIIIIQTRKLTKPIITLNKLVKNASEGDFSIQAEENSNNELGTLSKSFNRMTTKISGILSRITIFTKEVIQSSSHLVDIEKKIGFIRESVHEIFQGTDSQNQDVKQVIIHTEQMEKRFTQLKEGSELLITDSKLSVEMRKQGIQNIEQLRKQNEITTQMMKDSYKKIIKLEDQSKRISEIVTTIQKISSQTKLLSLNASIEAARSGEQGFAVVAKSIGKLASDSTIATKDIEQIIQEFCRDIDNTVENIKEMQEKMISQMKAVMIVDQTFDKLEEMNSKTTSSIQEIEKMVNEMYQINNSVVSAINRISDISKNTAELTKDSFSSLQEQYEGIRIVAERVKNLSLVSVEMEQEMSKFKV